MNTLTSPPLIFMELLADRDKNPSALMLAFSAGETDALLPLAEHPDFRALTNQFPCFVLDADDLPSSSADLLQTAGCRLMPADRVYRSDELDEILSPDAEWLAGNWYLMPPPKPTASQAASRAMALQLLHLVTADADTHEIEAVLRRDPALSYHLLRVVNSLGMGLSKRITSFSQAILILGRQQLRRWLNLMLFSAGAGDTRSAMLLARVAARSRTMELLARAGGLDKAGQELAFMAGMFSLLGILFGSPLEQVLQPLGISDALRAALLAHEGELGHLLHLVEVAERGDVNAVTNDLDAFKVAHAEFNLLGIQATTWMLDVIRGSQGPANA